LKKNASVWFGCVLRGDNESITIGEDSNVQENSILHTDMGSPLVVGDNVTIGHNVILHGCTIGDGALIGMGAVVLDKAVIGRHCLVGAGALVTEGKTFPDYSVILGSPAKAVRTLTPEEADKYAAGGRHYVENAKRFRRDLAPM
jgi:carbonic anhydrase/acetyltransferase-like protein (isoleucine patch superfamily)